MKILETNHLLLREFEIEDAPFIFELLNTPTWLQYIGDRGIKNLDDAKKYISEKVRRSYTENGFGLYLTLLKQENIPIGMCGILKRDHLDDADIGFAFSPEYTGKGYAFEAAFATLNYARDVLKLDTILAITTIDNLSSIKLLKKLNLNFEKMIHLPDDKDELMLFSNKIE